ncbi:acetate--CoA ligase family protein [Bacillus dakarensis]|uniref:acetate--CoA ligase family protein n=1 Tax=Robertmurraya dakarensis TaxID=1926278 RepID=UPI00111559B0|nr:CoA-binding protein [Bacillus dakarensis]
MSRMEAVRKLLYPRSLAVIGASNHKNKSGGRLMDYLTKHKSLHSIYPVNPKEETVFGKPCYQSVKQLPDHIDLALVVLPGRKILKVVEECAAKGINVLAVYSSGFAEMGGEGVELQQKLLERAKELGVYICGPNMIGVVNANQRFFGSFSMAMETPNIPRSGKIAFVSQSGAIGGGILSKLWSEGIGISHFISSGNEADLDTADYLSFLAEDEQTEIICVYLEGVKDGRKLIDSLQKANYNRKPVIIYKNGRTSIGQKSVQSHTGSLAGNYQVYETVFKQYGAIYVDVLEDMFEVAKGFLSIKNLHGKNVAVISTSGGACTIIADNCLQAWTAAPRFLQKHEGLFKASNS